jgi:serine/threonine protein kinase
LAVSPSNLEAIFLAAVGKPSGERSAYLDEACGGDLDLRRRVEQLLSAHERAQEAPLPPDAVSRATQAIVPEIVAGSVESAAADERPGKLIDSYKLMQLIGEGGMGFVWVAEQERPVRRRVALKVIKPGMDSGQVIRRFEAERQALALMDHTNIAKVFDAGTTDSGRPYFVMELVKGVPITKYCDELHLSVSERLRLFVPVCQAIHHAHQKGIIHRDIKPSNVLVAMQDGRPVPKVIDFGVAKALHAKLADRTVYTEIGAVMGTFEYMAPEQAELSALDVDTRADVYALGAMLYELLTGSTPLDRRRLRSAALGEVLRLIREEEPPKPSTRLAQSPEVLASLAAIRRTEPAKLTKLVRGDLDWIAMRCLEKDRTRRYETATGLARDVERYLADEPVEASPPSTVYRMRKFARKHKAGLLTLTTVALLLVAATTVSTAFALWAKRNEAVAVAARTDLERANDELRRSQDELEGALARSFIRGVRPWNQPVPWLSTTESEALGDLARRRSARLSLRFLDEALRSPLRTAQLGSQAEPALIAAVGLDPDLRAQAERLLADRLRDQGTSLRHQADIALLGLELAVVDPELITRFTDVFRRAVASETESVVVEGWLRSLAFYSDHVPPTACAGMVLAAFGPERRRGFDRAYLAECLATVAPRLPPVEAKRLCASVARGLADGLPQDAEPHYVLKGLVALADYLSPEEAAELCAETARLLLAPSRRLEREDARQFGEAARLLPPSEAVRLLMGALGRADNYFEQRDLVAGLLTSARRLPSSESAHYLLDALGRTTGPDSIARQFDPQGIDTREQLAVELGVVSGRLSALDANRLCVEASRRLTAALERTANGIDQGNLAIGLAAVVAPLSPSESERVCADAAGRLSDALGKEADRFAQERLAKGLAAVAGRLPAVDSERICGTAAHLLADALGRELQWRGQRPLMGGLVALAGRLPPSDAVRLLSDALRRVDPDEQTQLAEGLAALAGRLPPADAERACADAVNLLRDSPRGLTALADRLSPADAARLLAGALRRFKGAPSRHALATGLAAVCRRLPAADVARVAADAADILRQRLAEGGYPDPTFYSFDESALAHIVQLLPTAEAHRIALELTRPDRFRITHYYTSTFPETLDRLLTIAPPVAVRHQLAAAAATTALGVDNPTNFLAVIPVSVGPRPCRLTTQELVDLLKLPACIGDSRRVVLKHLGNHYGLSFASRWEFVRFAKGRNLDLDFNSPPRGQPNED